jgi:hypothetical protein
MIFKITTSRTFPARVRRENWWWRAKTITRAKALIREYIEQKSQVRASSGYTRLFRPRGK